MTQLIVKSKEKNYVAAGAWELPQYVALIGEMPVLPQIILATTNEKVVWVSSRWVFAATSLWLRNILLGQPLSPKAYEYKAVYAKPFAEYLAATFRLAADVYARTKSEELLNYSSPATLWFHCCQMISERNLQDSGLTGRPALIGKREYYRRSLRLYYSLRSHSFEPESLPTAMESPEMLLLIEAQAIAETDQDFHRYNLLPYLRVFHSTISKVKNCKHLQIYYLLPDGKLFITGKGLKIPKLEYFFGTRRSA